MLPEDVSLFLSVRQHIDRSAFTRYRQERSIDARDREAVERAHAEFLSQRPLSNPRLVEIARTALVASRGYYLDGKEPFPMMIWMYGATNKRGGRAFTGTISQFANVLLKERAKHIAPKREGWVVEPTTNPTGERTNEATLAMHALFLDCDGGGEWLTLLGSLLDLGLAHLVYQSGGWTSTTPKWRIVLPLDKPFDTSTPEKRIAWKAIYNHARVCLGALGQLAGFGFDPATETPCCPWFLTEKRAPEDPERQIVFSPGYTLDLDKLTVALPPAPADIVSTDEHVRAERLEISEEHFEEIVDALAASTAHVPAGRRDIYLSTPAVLLNRGVSPDDVRLIMEEVSSRYPRQHADKHADNLHCTETTIARWESDGPNARITQIGTLQALAPEVAAALDEVLPDETDATMAEIVELQLTKRSQTTTPATNSDAQPAEVTVQPPPGVSRARRPKLSPLAKKLSTIAKRLREHKIADRRTEGLLMTLVLRGEKLPADDPALVDKLVQRLSRALGYHLPATTWQTALEIMSPTLLAMDFTQSTERVKAAEMVFWEGRRGRNKVMAKREKKKQMEQERRAASARETV